MNVDRARDVPGCRARDLPGTVPGRDRDLTPGTWAHPGRVPAMSAPVRPPEDPMAVPRTRLSLALAAGVFALALADCSSSGASSGGSGGASDAAASAPAAAAAGPPAAAAGGAKAPDGTQKSQTQAGDAPAAAVKQRVIRTAHVVVRVDGELAPAAAKVRAITEGLGGTVASETTTFADTGDPGTTTSGSDPSASPDAGSPAPSVTSPA